MFRKKSMMICFLATACAGVSVNNYLEAKETPVELGKVKWKRNLEMALQSSKKSGKPVFAFFQEVPG